MNLTAGWDTLTNGGGTEGGGTLSMQFLLYRTFLFWLIPLPVNIAWFIVFHLFFAYWSTTGIALFGFQLGIPTIVVLEIKLLKVALPAGITVIATGLMRLLVNVARLLNSPRLEIESVNEVPSAKSPPAIKPLPLIAMVRG